MRNFLKIVGIGDLHFGNARAKAQQLYLKLRKYVYPELKDAHLIVITGDIYDQLLTVNSQAHHYATLFMSDLFAISAQTGLQIRLLHGTYTHDRDQLNVFHALKRPNAKYKIITAIEAEEISTFFSNDEEIQTPLRIAYLPDNLPYKKSEDAIEHLQRTLTVLGWTSVDLIVGHGSFAHVMPANSIHKPPCLYSFEQFDKIVPNGHIIMGHIHTPGRSMNVTYCGSFERMAHGEEEKKGFYVFTRDLENKVGWKTRFVENELAIPFITITPEGADTPTIIQSFLSQMDDKFPIKKGFVRVLHANPEIRSILHKISLQHFPEILYSSKTVGEKEIQTMQLDEVVLDMFSDELKPNENNLGDLVYQFLEDNRLTNGISKDAIVNGTHTLLTQ